MYMNVSGAYKALYAPVTIYSKGCQILQFLNPCLHFPNSEGTYIPLGVVSEGGGGGGGGRERAVPSAIGFLKSWSGFGSEGRREEGGGREEEGEGQPTSPPISTPFS